MHLSQLCRIQEQSECKVVGEGKRGAQGGLFEKLPSVGGTINIHNFHAYHDCFQHLGLPELTLLEITAGQKRRENDSLAWENIYSSSQHSLDGTILHTCFTLSSRASWGLGSISPTVVSCLITPPSILCITSPVFLATFNKLLACESLD